VLGPPSEAAIFLVVTVDPGAEPVARDLLADLAGLRRAVGFRVPEGGLSCVTGVGSAAWDRLFSGPRPAELHTFRELTGGRHRAVSTPGDLLFHVRARQTDLCFELAAQIMGRLAGSVTVTDEVHGLRRGELCHRAEVRARHAGMERPADRGAGESDRPHQAV
jgi:putative iron-dependent peroxidase